MARRYANAWSDAAAGMTALSLSDDGVGPAQAFPFTFRFYGLDYTQLYVGANGLIGFASQSLSSAANTDLPNASTPNNVICPFWGLSTMGCCGARSVMY